jgi:translation initiation factor 1
VPGSGKRLGDAVPERSSNPETLVYSTEPGRLGRPTPADAHASGRRSDSAAPTDGSVRIWLEKKGRNGKPVSIVRGLRLERRALSALAARLKRTCGSGGSAKDGEIIIQGDHRARIAAELSRAGLRAKLAGG